MSEHDPHDVDVFEVPDLPETDEDHDGDHIPLDAEITPVDDDAEFEEFEGEDTDE